MIFKIQTEQFEGPLDLLLNLIEKEKLDITKISLAKITEEYLDIISKLNSSSYDIAEFVLVASKLLYIKSKALLPSLETKEEEEDINDLEEKLKEYKKYKEATELFHATLQKGFKSYKSGIKAPRFKGFVPPEGIEFEHLSSILKEILEQTPDEEQVSEKVFEKLITVEEKRFEIKNHILKIKKITFKQLLKKAKTRHEIVVSFLAILDLIKQKTVKVKQDENFGDIILELTEQQKNITTK